MTDRSQPAVPWDVPVEPAGPAPGIDFAPHGPRLLANIIDSLLLTLVFIGWFLVAVIGVDGIGGAFSRTWLTDNPIAVFAAVAWVLVLLIVYVMYFPFCWAHGGQTLGMRPFRLWVVRDADGGPLTWKHATLRALGFYLVSGTFYLGFVWVFIDKRRRAWHDLIAGTVVIRRR